MRSHVGEKLIGFSRKVLRRAGFDFVRVADPYRLDVYHRLFSKDVLRDKPFYNVGAGAFYHPYWTNIDYASKWYSGAQRNVVHHDLMSLGPLPVPTSSAYAFYTSHTIEHVSYEAVAVLFREVFRALRPEGVFRITTGPDAETDFKALQRRDSDWFYWDKAYASSGTYKHIFRCPANSVPLEERWLHHVASQLAPNDLSPSPTKLDAVKIQQMIMQYGFPKVLDVLTGMCSFNADRPGNHISWWTHDRVIDLLRGSGFEVVYRSGNRQSISPLMRQSDLFDSTHPQMSIYVEAMKT